MTITVDNTIADWNAFSGASGSFDVAIGDVLVVCLGSVDAPGTFTVSNSGTNLTWSRARQAANHPSCEIWTARATGAQTGITVSVTQGSGQVTPWPAKVFKTSGAHASAYVGNSATGSLFANGDTTLTTTATDSVFFVVVNDGGAGGVPGLAGMTTDGTDYGTDVSTAFGYKTIASPGAQTQAVTFTGSPDAEWCSLELINAGATVEQEGFRFRNDDGSETTATWRQAQDTNEAANLNTELRLRMLLNATLDLPSTAWTLQYKEDSEATALWRAIGVGAPGSTPTVVGSGSAALATNDPSVNLSTGGWTPAENDVVVFFIASTTVLDLVVNASLPTGWFGVLGSGVDVNSDAHGYCAVYHAVTAGEVGGGTTFTCTNALAAAETGNVVALAIRGVDPAAIVHKAGSTFDSGNTVTPGVLAALTGANQPTLSGCLVVRGISQDSTGTWTTPGAHTAQASNNTNQTNAVFTRDAATTAASDVAATNITPDAGDEYCSITIAFTPAPGTPGITYFTSANYANAAATTAQLTAPSGKTTSDFAAGVMVEAAALANAVDITADDYTEIEWAIKPQSPAVNTEVYQFRVTNGAVVLDTYTVTPQLTIGSADTNVSASVVTGVVSVPTPTITASGNVTTTVVTGLAVVPTPTIIVSRTAVTTVVTAAVVVPTPTITASGNLTTAIVTGIVVVPTPTITASGNVTTTTVTGVAVVPTPSIVTENTTTVNATTVTALAVVNAPTITASGNVTTVTVTAPVVVGAPVVSASVTATAAVVTGVVVVNAPTITASGNVTTTTVTGVAVVPTPTVTASTTVTPTTVTGVAIVNAPNISSTVTPTTVTGVVEVFSPSISTENTVTVNASTVTALAVVDTPTITASGNVTTTTVTGVVSVGAPTISLSYTALAATVTAPVVIGSPTITASGTVTPNTVTVIGSVESPTVSTAVTVTPTTVTGVGVVPPPGTSVTTTAAVVTGVVVIPTPSVSTDSSATANAVVVTGVASVGSPTITASVTVTPTTVTALAIVNAPNVTTVVVVSATTVTASVEIGAPVASGSTAVSPAVVTGVVAVFSPTITADVTLTPTTVTAIVEIPTPEIVGISVAGVLALTILAAQVILRHSGPRLSLSIEAETLDLGLG